MTWIYASLVLVVVVFVITGFTGGKREFRDGAGSLFDPESANVTMIEN